jgi:hypothetical protein
MPTQPAASPSQKNLLTGFVTLAQTAGASAGNQLSIVAGQVATFQDGVNLFQSRYSFWDQYVSQYDLEIQALNGTYQTNPVVTADFTAFLTSSGRLYTAGSQTVTRVAEFDGTGATSTDLTAEAQVTPAEAVARTLLTSGFADAAIPTGLVTNGAVTPATTSVTVQNALQSQVVIPVGGRILISTGVHACIAIIQAVTENQTPHTVLDPPDPPIVTYTYTYTLTIAVQTTGFASVAIGATLASQLIGFTNTERTNQIPVNPALQQILTNWIAQYQSAITAWHGALSTQATIITGEINEDMPDSAYITAQGVALTQLTNFLAAVNVSDAGFAPILTLVGTRASAITARVGAITSRIAATMAYDARYKYADLLYNLGDGQLTQVQKLQGQQGGLAAQQTASNARAAKLQAENN